MDEIEKLNDLRMMTEPSEDNEATLLSYLRQAKNMILNRMYPYLDGRAYEDLTLPKKYDDKQVQLAAYLMNKRGAEGQTRHIENGISRTYQGAYAPQDLLCDVLPMVGIPM